MCYFTLLKLGKITSVLFFNSVPLILVLVDLMLSLGCDVDFRFDPCLQLKILVT